MTQSEKTQGYADALLTCSEKPRSELSHVVQQAVASGTRCRPGYKVTETDPTLDT